MRVILPLALAITMLAAPLTVQTQSGEDASQKNTRQARAVLDAMVQAMGGQAWLNIKNVMRQGHVAAFYLGKPSGGTVDYWEYHSWPDRDRADFSSRHDVVQFYVGRTGWEVTYRGKQQIPADHMEEYLRRRYHSIETAMKLWLNDPRTILIYEGQRLAERHLADQVTLISGDNEAITILMDTQTHLPLRRTFQYRDPVYKDKDLDAEEYDDYHAVDGFPTPVTITRFKNDDVTRQYFLTHVVYNQDLPRDFWDVDATTMRIKKK